MKVQWTEAAKSDLVRLYAFLEPVAPDAAAMAIGSLIRALDRFAEYPRIGEKLDLYAPREIRRIKVGRYDMHYEIVDATILILRVWHSRKDRGQGRT